MTLGEGAGGRLLDAGDETGEGRFARTVDADDGDLVPALDREVEILDDLVVAVVAADFLELQDGLTAALGLGKAEIHGCRILLELDALDLLERLDPRLHHLRLRGLGTETVDEFLGLLDLPGLILEGALGLLAAGDALLQVEGVVPRILLHAAILEGEGAVREIVEHAPVVRDQDDGAVVVAQPLLEPLHRLDVEVVGRFVEKKDGGLLQEQFRHRDTHLPAAAELAGLPVEILFRKAEPAQHRGDAGLHLADVVVIEPQGEIAEDLEEVAVGLARRIGRLEFGFDFFQLDLQLANVIKGLLDLFHHRRTFVRDTLLRQIPDRGLLRLDDASGIGLLDPRDDFHQGRLAGAIRSSERPALLRAHGEGEVPEEIPGPVLDTDTINGKHEGRESSALFQSRQRRARRRRCSRERSARFLLRGLTVLVETGGLTGELGFQLGHLLVAALPDRLADEVIEEELALGDLRLELVRDRRQLGLLGIGQGGERIGLAEALHGSFVGAFHREG